MKQKISIGLSGVACLLILALLLMIGHREVNAKRAAGEPAADYEQLELYIKHGLNAETIHIWKSEAECYYFFLPAYAVNSQVFFGNLGEEGSITIGGRVFGPEDDVSGAFEYNVVYDMYLDLEDSALQSQNVVFLCSSNIPSLHIQTQSGTAEYIHNDKEAKESAKIAIYNESGETEFSGEIDYIKTRGNSTFLEVEKKSYQIKLFNKKSLFGMGEAKKWILLANAKDDSLIRNAVIFDFATEYTDIASVEGVFVDVYLNGDYVGNYYLCEKVEVSENRLNIHDLDKENSVANFGKDLADAQQYVSEDGTIRAVADLGNPDDITGGYLLERIITDEYPQVRSGFISEQGVYYRVVSPEHASIEQVEYICNFVNELEGAVCRPDGINPVTGKHFSEYMDVDSWVAKFLIEEFFHNPDAPYASTYLYKDSDSVDPRIHFGPVWDYDRAMGGYAVNVYYLDAPQQIGGRGLYATQLLEQESVVDLIKLQYKESFLPYLKRAARADVDGKQQWIASSAEMNKVRWPQTVGYYEEWDANGNYLMSFLETRAEYLSDIWLEEEQYHTVTFLDYYGSTYTMYKIKHGEYLTQIPDISAYVAIFNGWKNAATGKSLDMRLPVLEDAVYQSSWIGADILLLNGLAMADTDIKDIDVESLEALLDAVKKMKQEMLGEAQEEVQGDE